MYYVAGVEFLNANNPLGPDIEEEKRPFSNTSPPKNKYPFWLTTRFLCYTRSSCNWPFLALVSWRWSSETKGNSRIAVIATPPIMFVTLLLCCLWRRRAGFNEPTINFNKLMKHFWNLFFFFHLSHYFLSHFNLCFIYHLCLHY